MMEELFPLTISSSVRKNPTVLFTQDRNKFLLFEPFDGENHILAELFGFVSAHFKIESLKKGFFNFKGRKYMCCEERPGLIEADEWLSFQWKKKRQFNRFIRHRSLFDMYLIDLFFPVFGISRKLIVPGIKDSFVIHPFPGSSNEGLGFNPQNISNSGLNEPSIKLFFKHFKEELPIYLEDFLALHHDKFRADLKYRVSLYPDVRNKYWDEIQKCFDPDFKTYIRASVENYILKL